MARRNRFRSKQPGIGTWIGLAAALGIGVWAGCDTWAGMLREYDVRLVTSGLIATCAIYVWSGFLSLLAAVSAALFVGVAAALGDA